ncbi:similar to testis-expressed transmembrane-4 protein Tetm4.2 (predicted) [Rattus norvegicus]|uniref:Similar to testis-expressed transmembrane-4 protein Tetm4.2 (Predicted) n=1 Tax=Rattus norvegicus TaxID=10116 RepID=A6I083_RAT|nr:similar to testis-expressed transmembrane-4 protein Tetm4.2 (predicted) [Rattus norvegicus]
MGCRNSKLLCTMSLNILCIIVTIIAASLTIVELSHFRSVSYRNYGQAMETQDENSESVTEVVEDNF